MPILLLILHSSIMQTSNCSLLTSVKIWDASLVANATYKIGRSTTGLLQNISITKHTAHQICRTAKYIIQIAIQEISLLSISYFSNLSNKKHYFAISHYSKWQFLEQNVRKTFRLVDGT